MGMEPSTAWEWICPKQENMAKSSLVALFLCCSLILIAFGGIITASTSCGLSQDNIQYVSARWVQKNKRLLVEWRFLPSVPKQNLKLSYSLRVHHWTNATDVPNVEDVKLLNGNKSQWRDTQRLKSRPSSYKQTLRDLDHNCYYVIELGIFSRSGFKSKSPCLIQTSEVIFSGRQGLKMYVNANTDGPPIRQPGGTVTVKSGSDLTLECVGYGHPPPHVISWSRVGLLPLPPISSPRDEVIQLNNISTSADGTYICTVSNYYIAPDYARTVNTETVYVAIKVVQT